MAITIAKVKATLTPKERERTRKLMLEEPRVIVVAGAEGTGRNGVMISLHKDYADFRDFISNLRFDSEGYVEDVDSMLIGLQSNMIIKPLSLSYLAGREDV